jgi:hypothetical protein
MKRFVAVAMVLGLATTTLARQPILVPPSLDEGPVTAQYAPQPTPAIPAPPSPALNAPQTRAPIGTLVMTPQPIPETVVEPGMILGEAQAFPVISLYPKVRVVQARKIAPCAVSKIVAVPDPCDPCGCAFISICVPPCACEHVFCSPHKDRVIFNYGEYQVKVTNRRGTLVVNYDN